MQQIAQPDAQLKEIFTTAASSATTVFFANWAEVGWESSTEAEQISMGRRVALKVLPLAGLVDELKIKRFRNEVRAVAALDHPNIVSVHTVGEERGVHYYAMQLIRGRSLAEVISSLQELHDGGESLDGLSVSRTVSGGKLCEDVPFDLEATEVPATPVRQVPGTITDTVVGADSSTNSELHTDRVFPQCRCARNSSRECTPTRA